MKILVVGGVAGGASAAARARRLDEKAEIIMFERGEHISYSNCCLPYYLGGEVSDSKKLLMMTPASFKARFNIDVRTDSEVVSVDRAKKTVTVLSRLSGEEYEESYDKLILSPGADAVRPRSIGGLDLPHVFTVKSVNDVVSLNTFIKENHAKNIVVVGGGFIGIEVAENLKKTGLDVTVAEGAGQIMAPYDHDMVQMLHKELYDNGIKLYLNTMVKAVREKEVICERAGQEFSAAADAVVLAIGVSPNTDLAKACGLEIGPSRGIKVNEFYQTSDPDIYAVGDASESFDALAKKPGLISLAGPAQRQARGAADHIYGIKSPSKGFIGSSCIRIFGLNAARTGMNEVQAKAAGIEYEIAFVLSNDKVSIMPGSNYMAFKLLFEAPTGRIIGAQAIGRGDVTRRIDVIAAMITMGGTLEDLKDLELCYSPVFSTAKDIVNIAALVGLNVLNGTVKQVHVDQVRRLVEEGAYIIDVREEGEFAASHIKGARNIPLSRLRDRINEVPKDVPVYLHCRSAQRSYYAICQLQGNGYTNVYNISGSYLGISLYEYFTDVTTGREPILTSYNFE